MDASEQYIDRARLLIQQSRFDMAEEQLRLALSENSQDGAAHALLSLCLLQRDAFEPATEEAEQAIHCEPEEGLGHYALACVLQKRNRPKEARQAIAEAVRIEPWESMHWGRLAMIEGDLYHWEEALAAAENGLEADADDVTCTNMRAVALVNLGRRDEAGATIDAALSREPDNAITHANMGWTLLHSGRPKEAMESFREALRLDPNQEWARLGIVESMKARHFIYRWMLSWFLWMQRMPPRFQLALILGFVFGQSLLRAIFNAVPVLEPFAPVIVVTYVLFVWMTWTASSLFNLVLRLDRFGRLALNENERLCSTLVGTCILATVATGIWAHVSYAELASLWWITALMFLGLTIPVSSTFQMTGQRKLIMAAYSIGLLVVIGTALWHLRAASETIMTMEVAANMPQADLKKLLDEILAPWRLWNGRSTTGIVISTWLGLGLSMTPQRR